MHAAQKDVEMCNSLRERRSDTGKLLRAAHSGNDAKVKRLLKANVDVNAMTTCWRVLPPSSDSHLE